ncbi:hypothetical protein BH10ACT10_BH10ACT10_16850 [soil metagenome]
MTSQQPDRVQINWVQVSASALAAVSSAVLLSTVGVAGTIIGAAVGSVFATAGSAIYSHYLRASRSRVASAQAAALERLTHARSGASGVWADGRRADASGRTMMIRQQHADEELDEAQDALDVSAPGPSWREVLAGLRWKRIAAVAGGIFVVAMLVIVSFELVTGRAVSTYTGGSGDGARTSIPGLGAKQSSGTPDKTPAPATPTQEPSSAPTSSPTTGESPTAAPSESPSSTPTDVPTTDPTTTDPSPVPTTPAPSPTVPMPAG